MRKHQHTVHNDAEQTNANLYYIQELAALGSVIKKRQKIPLQFLLYKHSESFQVVSNRISKLSLLSTYTEFPLDGVSSTQNYLTDGIQLELCHLPMILSSRSVLNISIMSIFPVNRPSQHSEIILTVHYFPLISVNLSS